ncbi:MAG: transglutaminase-like domain-containing protein [Planctomycetaceae bacterium]
MLPIRPAQKPPGGESARAVLAAVVGLAALLTAWTASQPARADEPAQAEQRLSFEENWQVVYIGKSRVGFGRSATERLKRGGRDMFISDSEMTLAITRFGQSAKTKIVTRSEETPEGDLLRFQFELQNPPAATTRTTGRVENGRLLLETERGGVTEQKELPWDAGAKAPGYQDRLLRENPLRPGEKRTLKTFDPQFGRMGTVTLSAEKPESVQLLDGRTRDLLRVAVVTSLAPVIVLHEYLDEKGEALVTKTGLLGLATYQTTRDEALKALSGDEADLAVATLIRTTPIERAQETRRVVYRVKTAGEDPAKILPDDAVQSVVAVDGETAKLTVRALVPPERPLANAAPAAPEFVAANSHIQSDDALVRKCADEAAGSETDPWVVARRLERWVCDNVREKNFSTLLASAAEVAKDRSGDCTEHAVLLAAMARAKGIPSRAVVGLLYVPKEASFGGHMWTEVYIRGQWVPLDGTLGQGGVAADRIKFADTSFADDSEISPIAAFLPLVAVLGKLQIEALEVEHR